MPARSPWVRGSALAGRGRWCGQAAAKGRKAQGPKGQKDALQAEHAQGAQRIGEPGYQEAQKLNAKLHQGDLHHGALKPIAGKLRQEPIPGRGEKGLHHPHGQGVDQHAAIGQGILGQQREEPQHGQKGQALGPGGQAGAAQTVRSHPRPKNQRQGRQHHGELGQPHLIRALVEGQGHEPGEEHRLHPEGGKPAARRQQIKREGAHGGEGDNFGHERARQAAVLECTPIHRAKKKAPQGAPFFWSLGSP
jgi:hypothetical protein